MSRHKKTKKQLFTLFTHYGVHIWAILIIANAVMVYTYQIATHAAGKNDTTIHALDVSGTPSPSLSPSPVASTAPSPSTAPVGPAINLVFTVPGIGSGGGIMKPVHTQRNITIYLFAPSVNSMDPTVNPLYTVQGTATFDSNPYSPTYTSFISPVFDLGSSVQDGEYQVAFRTDLSFTTLVKQGTSAIGGEVFSLSKGSNTLTIPPQTVLMGDVIPSGNNYSFTINDYNAFINCFGDKNKTSGFCKGKSYGDFNDDGVIDGVDYNILLRSLNGLLAQGQTLPKITIEPTIPIGRPTLKPAVTVKPTTALKKAPTKPASSSANTNKSSGGAGGLLAFFFLIILGIVGFVVIRKNENIRTMITSLIHLSPTGAPSQELAQEVPVDQTTSEESPQEAQTQPEAEQEETTAVEPAPPAPPASPAPAPAPAPAGDVIEKDCYIKVKGPDDSKKGLWLLLTDDNGATNAHYAKNDVQDGFAKVKGIMKTENDKTFLEISELSAEG